MNRILLSGKNPLYRLFALILIIIISVLIFGFLGYIGGYLIFGEKINIVVNQNASLGSEDVLILKYFQLVSHMSMFFIPAFIFMWLFYRRPVSVARSSSFPSIKQIALGLLIIILVQPLVSLVSEWNSNLHLPDSMQNLENAIRSTEESIGRLTTAFLKTNSFIGFLYNLLLIAVIPAIGEEWLFRGVIQKELKRWFKNAHVAIWLTGILFSLIHFQFYGFFPRIILGVLLGYLFVYSGNLWVPIAAHFLNNAMSVGAVYFFGTDITDTSQSITENQLLNISLAIFSTGFMLIGLRLLIKKKSERFARFKPV